MARNNQGAHAATSTRSAGGALSQTPGTGSYSSRASGTRAVPQGVRVAAAKARVSADKKRGVTTEAWIVDLANKAS